MYFSMSETTWATIKSDLHSWDMETTSFNTIESRNTTPKWKKKTKKKMIYNGNLPWISCTYILYIQKKMYYDYMETITRDE